ncbi:MAG: hypothetical protein PVF68_09820 [Acidobacteriota bacterium]|jgi:hypothetical protein
MPASTRNLRLAIVLLVPLALLLGACGTPAERTGSTDDEATIRAAIEDYLRQERRIDPDVMRMEVVDVRVEGTAATAVARYSTAAAPDGMEFEYVLERAGDGWKVTSSRPRGGHGGQPVPEGHPPAEPQEGSPSTAS